LNDCGLGNIDQLVVHVVQESAWNVIDALRTTCRALGCLVKGKEMEVIGQGFVTVMASSSADVKAPSTSGVQVTEWPLVGSVPAGIFSAPTGALN
jgi:hypothetical protein